MINFSLPGIQENYKLNLAFIDYFHEYPERFYDNVNIESCFGNFQFCIFDGGRVFDSYQQVSKEFIEKIVALYNNKNIPLRLVFTNTKLSSEHYYDRFANIVLNVCNNYNNGVILNDNNLMEYIHDNYQNLNFISSTTKCIETIEETVEELKNENYSIVCLNYNLNKKIDELNSLPKQLKDKCEILVNAICPPGCKNRKKHYDLNSEFNLNYGKPYDLKCAVEFSTLHPQVRNFRNNLSFDDIKQYYDKGFSHFKIEGRTFDSYEVMLNYIYYMIKPEWKDETIHALYLMEKRYE